jgi:sigma-B regulation protein RsbU (phosphoserine phosphatase)
MANPNEQPTRVLLSAATQAAATDVRGVLERAGYAITWHDLNGDSTLEPGPYQLIVVDGSRQQQRALQLCRRLRGHLAEGFVPILFVTEDHSPGVRLASLQNGADTYLLRPFAASELLAQIQAFLRIKEVHDRLAEKTAEVNRVNKRLQAAYQQIDGELALARRLQLSFLPQALPELPRLRFGVHYQLRGQVGGDFYDVFRLDEQHVGFYVADAVGHGVPASLLTIFVKKGICTKEIFGKDYCLVLPGEVLRRLNRDLIEQQLSEQPFITMVYGLLNFQTLGLSFARAGHPYPLHLPRQGEPQLWQVEGSLIGVFDTTFPNRDHVLRPGDKVLLYSDGIDHASFNGLPPGVESLTACAARLRALPVQEFVRQLTRELFGKDGAQDDLTFLALEVTE